MEFMSDEEFNRVMDEFDWDAPINQTQSEQNLPESLTPSTVEASRGPPYLTMLEPSLGPNTSEPVARAKSPKDPFAPTSSTDHTKRKTTNDTYVIPAEVYYDPEKCLFWDERDFDWTRPPQLSANRQPGLHQDTMEPSASSTKEKLDSTREEIDLPTEETGYSNDKSPSNCLTSSKSNQKGPIVSESGGTDLSLSDDVRPSTTDPPGIFRPMDVRASTSRQVTSSEILVQQTSELHPDLALSKTHPSAPEQGNDDTTNATVSEDPTNATVQDYRIIASVITFKKHMNAMEHGNETTTDVPVFKDGDRAIDQDDGIMTDMPALKDRADSIEQGDGITIEVTLSNDHESTYDQGNELITSVPVSTNHAKPVEQVDGIFAKLYASKDCNGGMGRDGETFTDVPALKDRMDCTPKCDGITANVTVSENPAIDQVHEIITVVPACTDDASPTEQGDSITAHVDVSKDLDRAIDQDAGNITKLPAYLGSMTSMENSDGFNTHSSVFKTDENTIDQTFGNGQHEATTSGTTVVQDSAEMQGIEKTSAVISTETRLMAVAPKRPQRLFSSAVSLSSIPVRGGVKTRKSVNPFLTWQPPISGKMSDIPESHIGIPRDISESSNIGKATITAPASASLSSPVGPSEDASEMQSSPALSIPSLRESSAHLLANVRSTHSPPPVDAPPLANEIRKSLEAPHEPQAISLIDASTPAEHTTEPVEAMDSTRYTSTQSATADEEALLSQIENHDEQSLCDEGHCSTEEHPANSRDVVDLTHLSSTLEVSTPTTESSLTPEAIHEALLSPIINACAVEYFTNSEAVQEVSSVSGTEVELPQKPLHDAQASFAPVSFANSGPPFDSPEAVHEADSQLEGDLAHPIGPQGNLDKAQSLSAPDIPVATEDAVGPPKTIRRIQSTFVQFVCTPTEEPVSPPQAAQLEEARPSPTAEASRPVHDRVDHLGASHEGQAVPAPDTDSVTEKDIALVEAAHEFSEAFTVSWNELTEDSGAPLEAAQEVNEHRNSPDEDVSLVESNSGSVELLEPSKPQVKVVVPSPGETLTPPDSRRSSLRSRTPLKQSFQEPVSSLQEITALMEEPGTIGSTDAVSAKRDRTAPKKTTKDRSRARRASNSNRSTRSNTKETSTHPKPSTPPIRTAPLPDDESALQVKHAQALPAGDDVSLVTQQQASGDETRLVCPEKASQAELSSEYYDELAMSDPEDSRCIPLAIQLTPQRKHQVHNSMSSPSVKPGRYRRETQSTDTAPSVKARKRARTGPQGRKLIGDRELSGLLMRQDTPDTKVRRIDGGTEVIKLVKKAIDEAKSSNGKATEDAPEKGVGKAAPGQTPLRKRGRNKSLDLTSNRKVIEKKSRRSGRLSDGVDTTEDVEVAKNDKPRRSGRLVDGTMK
ncbi:MAG: hypothetical protein OHK93_000630 [Ramalina farinacea]|uniref:Uncharacterized protein n=1 Tax=Ramalina farinacea TaxID=258253 RepID=A0AA43TVA2_9LECA|nr:hypothetical protein [Ramalina farinacea]